MATFHPFEPGETTVALSGEGVHAQRLAAALQALGVRVVDAETATPASASILACAGENAPPAGFEAKVRPSVRAYECGQRRDRLREIATQELGLPVTPYRVVEKQEELLPALEELGYPCVLKSADATTKGMALVHSAVQAVEAYESFLHVAPAEKLIVERFVHFEYELTILAVRSIDPATGELATWFSEPIGHIHDQGLVAEAWQPMQVRAEALDNARSMAARITNNLGGTGLYVVEMFVDGEEVYFSDANPGPQDVGEVTMLSQRLDQYQLHARALLGLPIDVTLVTPAAVVRFKEPIADMASALAIPEIDVRADLVCATAETIEIARERALQALG